jgi:hypothetical protein
MAGDDRAEVARSMQPLQQIMGKIAEADPETLAAPDGGRQGPERPKLGGQVHDASGRGGGISVDAKAPILDRSNRPNASSAQAGMGSRKAILANILMSTFLQNYGKSMNEKFKDDDELPMGEAKAKLKEAVNDAVEQTVKDCRGLENASLDDAQVWMKRNRSDPSRLGTADNIEAGRFKARRHTAKQLRQLNVDWKKEMTALYKEPDKPGVRLDNENDEDRIIELDE